MNLKIIMDIIKRVDELGRIVLPKKIRENLKIETNDYLLIKETDGIITLKKYDSMPVIMNENSDIIDSFDDILDARIYITDKEKILTKGELENIKLPLFFKNILNNLSFYQSKTKEAYFNKEGYFLALPLIKESNTLGLIIIFKTTLISESDILFAKLMQKIITK